MTASTPRRNRSQICGRDIRTFPAVGDSRPGASRILVQTFVGFAQTGCAILAPPHGSPQFEPPTDTWPWWAPASAITDTTQAWRSTQLQRAERTNTALLRKEKTSVRTRCKSKVSSRTLAPLSATLHPE